MADTIANGSDIDIPVLNPGCRPAGLTSALALTRYGVPGLTIAEHHSTAHTPKPEPETGTLPSTSIGKPRQSDGAQQLHHRAPRCTDLYRVDDSSSPHGRRGVQCPTSH